MSIKRFERFGLREETDRRTFKILFTIDQDPYPEEGWQRRTYKGSRMYGWIFRQGRSWKNYRGHQYR